MSLYTLILLYELVALAMWAFMAVLCYASKEGYKFVPVTIAAVLWIITIPLSVLIGTINYHRRAAFEEEEWTGG